MIRRPYTAPCRWYPGGPVGKIRFYYAKETALFLPIPTVFWPYRHVEELENGSDPGEITGYCVRSFHNGTNVNNLAGDHYEGTPADFLGLGVDPHASS